MDYTINDELDYICKLSQTNTSMNIFIKTSNNLIKEYKFPYLENPFFSSEDLCEQLFTEIEATAEIPFIKSLNNIEYYSCIRTANFDFIMGPCVLEEVSNNLFYDYIKRHNVPLYLKKSLQTYLNSVPHYKKANLINMSQLVYFLLFRKQINASDIEDHSQNITNAEENIDFELSIKRVKEQLHHDILLENNFNKYIKNGDVENIKNAFRNTLYIDKVGVVTPDNLIRNDKNLAIASVTIATRAAIEGGLHYEVAYSLSDILIQKIETEQEFVLVKTVERIFIEFATKVKNLNTTKYSQPIHQVQQYIYNHLYQPLTLDKLAAQVHISSKYLSHLFKEEVGVTLSTYITEKKLEEAKIWLDNSNLSISEIAHQLSFSDQSHFIKVFKRNNGITPKQYRVSKVEK
ncbi:helix-turn-helix domain-containing protein [Mammaliicoccus sp. K-M42]|uniref:helix-turn-helix domain-containing protein n=1 Tax=Mammaliicoccus sp. K-M42 TaxID=2898701 RepID=UPI001EFAEC7E|nr:helix-turn-helix domain-containing protein [Mammaliicoccus sp. K-M42]